MDVTETDLPGVGKRFEVDLGGDETAIVLIHNNGCRELFHRPESGADAEKLLELSDREARTIGSLLEGAHFQPIATDTTETTIGEVGIMLEWYTLAKDAELAGMSRRLTGAGRRRGHLLSAHLRWYRARTYRRVAGTGVGRKRLVRALFRH